MRNTKNFDFITPISWGSKNPQRIDLRIMGIGYEYTNNDPENRYDYDIEQVLADGQDFTNIYRLLESDCDSRLADTIAEATSAHMEYLFTQAAEPDHTDTVQNERPYSVIALAGTTETLLNGSKKDAA